MNAAAEGDLLRALREGRLVAAPTETFYGLLADARSPGALARVVAVKGRDAAKGISVLLPSREAWASLVVDVPPVARALADAFWPGPLTIALPARAGLDERLLVDGTIAVRLAGPSVGASLAASFGGPLTATSANRAGAPPAVEAAAVRGAFAPEVAAGDVLVAEGRAPGGAPSTLVVVLEGRVRLVREGAIAARELARVAGPVPVVR